MGCNVGVDHGTPTGSDLRHLIGQLSHFFDAVKTGDLWGLWIFRTEFGASPFFLDQVTRREKENLSVGASRCVTLRFHRRSDEQGRTRLAQTGEIKEVILLAKAIDVVGPLVFHGREEHDDAGRLPGERLSPSMVVGARLTFESNGTCKRESNQQDYGPEK